MRLFPKSSKARVAPLSILVPAVLLATMLQAGTARAQADSADDVCAPNANPCNVTTVIDVADNAVLDFYNRAVTVSGSGQFNFGPNSGSILCGNFTATTTNPAIDANGAAAGGGTEGGTVTIKARRLCTGGTPKVPCIDINDCQIGTCGVRRCSLRPAKTCTADSNCQLGTCVNKRCSLSASVVRCSSNADCDYGTCPAQLTCSNKADSPVNCSTNGDCDFGTCSTGSASISMGGSIVGNSDNPASIILRAADNVSITKLVNLNSASLGSDGGDLTVEAAAGSVTMSGKLNATGGGDSQGGTLEIAAGQDVTIGDVIDVIGGDFDGGSVDIAAGRDIILNNDLLANSTAGAGFGGEILLDAGRDLQLNGVSASNKTTIETNGNTDAENFAGDGGTQDITTGRNMTLGVNTRLVGNGSAPDGFGSDMFFDVAEAVTLNGDITAKALGGQGAGGFVEMLIGGATSVGSTGTFDVTGGEGGGGLLEIETDGNMVFAGAATATATNAGAGGTLVVDSNADMTFSGTMSMTAAAAGSIEVEGCRVTLSGTGKLDNKSTGGDNRIVSRESMKLLSGSSMTTVGGPNQLRYRTSAKPPQVSGTVSPAPQLVLDPALVGCPVCGNSEIDQGETCDDGNLNNSDGCSSTCQNEKCLQQTISPGFPTVPLCEDGNVCTADVCNTSLNGGTCQHPAKNCSDGFSCTTDSCNAQTGACINTPNDGLCNDQNPCTDDACSVDSGCFVTANTDPCNDGNSCTSNDTCTASLCQGTPIQGCGVCGDGVVNPPEQCDDGNATFTTGEYCGVGCVLIPCGKPTNSAGSVPTSTDALIVLRTAVGQTTCSLRVCDVDNTGAIVASDALRVLRLAVGQSVTLTCPTS